MMTDDTWTYQPNPSWTTGSFTVRAGAIYNRETGKVVARFIDGEWTNVTDGPLVIEIDGAKIKVY